MMKFEQKFMDSLVFFSALKMTDEKNPSLRFARFAGAVTLILREFDRYPELMRFKVCKVVTFDINKMHTFVDVQHHYTVTGIDSHGVHTPYPHFGTELPFAEMGNGVFEFERDSAEVQEYLRISAQETVTSATEINYKTLIFRLCLMMDQSFTSLYFQHR